MEVSEEIKNQIAADYNNNVSLRKLAVQYGISGKAYREILREKKVVILPSPSNGKGSRKYTSNGAFFDVIQREEQAYWLGFLSADGNIQGNPIRFELSSQDVKHLHKFVTALKADYPVHYCWHKSQGKYFKDAWVEINPEQLVYGLEALGVTPRKTKYIKPWVSRVGRIEQELKITYWRGWVDGDSCISFYTSKGAYKGTCTIGLVGNKAVMAGFRDFLTQSLGPRNSILFNPNNSRYVVSYSGIAAKKVARLLYENATVYLDRKMEKAQK